MKITRLRALLSFAAVAGTAALAAMLVRRGAATGPVLVVKVGGHPPAVATGGEERAVALAASSIAPDDRKRIVESMDYARSRLESRLSPLGTDFEDTDAIEQLRRSMQRHMPTFTAARELERGAWQSADLSVRVAASCAEASPAPDETCIALWDANDGPREVGRRARFLAWAASHAAVADLGTRERAEKCARALRARTSVEASTVAVVLMDDDLELRPTAERGELQDGARRLVRGMSASRARDAEEIEALTRPTPHERAVPWLHVPRTAVVVVPRLSAVADAAGLAREVEVAAGGPIRWVHAP